MHLHIYKNAAETSIALADRIVLLIKNTLVKNNRFTIALSGGETPKKLYQVLASATYRNKIDWSRLHIFWGDERMVPFNDERSNAKMAFDILLDNVNIPADQIHRIQTDIDPPEAALQYEKILHQYFDSSKTTFDVVLLGMGDDGHTLSLFPNAEVLTDTSSWVKADTNEQKGMQRITLMPAVVNLSSAIVFLVTGESKAKVLQQIIEEPQQHAYPSQLIQPVNGELYWFADEAAAKYLKK